MLYMLDTNACIGVINGKPASLRQQTMQCNPADLGVSQVVYFELLFSVCRSQQQERNQRNFEQFLKYIQVLDWSDQQSEEAATIRCELSRKGQSIGHYDTLIAAHARSLGLTLVTHNLREFERVDGLNVVDWEVAQKQM